MYVAHIHERMGDWGNIETAIHFFFFFCKNIFYKKIEAKSCKILRIFYE